MICGGAHAIMRSAKPARPFGLVKSSGARTSAISTPVQKVKCPFCIDADASPVDGFSTVVINTPSMELVGDVVLKAFACSDFHVFFLRDRDVAVSKGRA